MPAPIDPIDWRREGGTDLRLPQVPQRRGPAPRSAVFYNPAMAIDRDIHVAFAQAAARRKEAPWRAWEMLSATGVRGLRAAVESEAFAELLQTEGGPEAFAVLEENARRHAGRHVRAERADARERPPGAPFDFVDLDPYGSPVPFLATALGALVPGGILALTATDMMVLAGVVPGACERRYRARPVRGRLGPEAGLRILLAFLAQEARARSRSISPLLAYVHDHHVRAFVRIGIASAEPDPVGIVPADGGAGPPLEGNGPFGPMWLGPLWDADWVGALVPPSSAARPAEVTRFLGILREEAGIECPFYYESNTLARRNELSQPPKLSTMIDGLRAGGHRAARSHVRPGAFRTDADRDVVDALARSTSLHRAPALPASHSYESE